jgi:hypothetical protein
MLLLSENPLAHVQRTIPELDAVWFTKGEEAHGSAVHEGYLLKVEYRLLRATLDFCPQ